MITTPSVQRFAQLDALRGVAAMIVVIHHIWAEYSLKPLQIFPSQILVAGYSCVCLFFILSGFVLTYKFVGEENCYEKVITATIKRPFRLAGIALLTGLIGYLIKENTYASPVNALSCPYAIESESS